MCDAGPSMQPPTAANCAVRPNFFSDETLPASMLWQIRSPVVNEMQTAAMEREYARAVSIWTFEAISQRVGHDFHTGFIRTYKVCLPILSRLYALPY